MNIRVSHAHITEPSCRVEFFFMSAEAYTLILKILLYKRHSGHIILSLHGFNIGDILLLKPLILQVYHSGDEDQQITPILFVPAFTREKPGELPQILELLTLSSRGPSSCFSTSKQL